MPDIYDPASFTHYQVDKAYRAGRLDRSFGIGKDANPYKVDSVLGLAWDAGYRLGKLHKRPV